MAWSDPCRPLAAALLLSSSLAFAADSKPVARVGELSISADDLRRKLAQIPDFQRAALADNPADLKRRVLDTQLVPALLFATEAERLKLGARPTLVDRQREILRQAMERSLRADSAKQNPVTSADVQQYFDANRARFETPRRIRIWRILTDDEALAKKILADCAGVDGLKRWSEFARENSLDKATHLRDGDLGFVHPAGDTDTPTLRVDPSLFTAVEHLADGELAKAPSREGTHWAVLWRRGSAPALTRTVAQESATIREVLERQRLDVARRALLDGLRAKYVTGVQEGLLETVSFGAQGLPERAAPPLRSAHPAAAGSAQPTSGERGTR